MRKIIELLVVIIITAVITTAVTHFFPTLVPQKVALEFAPVYKEKFINIPSLLDGRVEILVDGKAQKNLSTTDVLLFNRSSKDIKNIPITFQFFNEDNTPLPKMLSKILTAPDTFPPDSITEILQKSNGSVRYEISSFPVSEDRSTDFVASFIFLGDKPPKVKVLSDYIDGKAISINRYNKEADIRNTAIVGLSVSVFVVFLLMFPIVWQQKRDKKHLLIRIGNIAEEFEGTDLPKDKLREIAILSYTNAIDKKYKLLKTPEHT